MSSCAVIGRMLFSLSTEISTKLLRASFGVEGLFPTFREIVNGKFLRNLARWPVVFWRNEKYSGMPIKTRNGTLK